LLGRPHQRDGLREVHACVQDHTVDVGRAEGPGRGRGEPRRFIPRAPRPHADVAIRGELEPHEVHRLAATNHHLIQQPRSQIAGYIERNRGRRVGVQIAHVAGEGQLERGGLLPDAGKQFADHLGLEARQQRAVNAVCRRRLRVPAVALGERRHHLGVEPVGPGGLGVPRPVLARERAEAHAGCPALSQRHDLPSTGGAHRGDGIARGAGERGTVGRDLQPLGVGCEEVCTGLVREGTEEVHDGPGPGRAGVNGSLGNEHPLQAIGRDLAGTAHHGGKWHLSRGWEGKGHDE